MLRSEGMPWTGRQVRDSSSRPGRGGAEELDAGPGTLPGSPDFVHVL